MLHLKKHLTFFTPSTPVSHQLVLTPVLDDDDELIQEINAAHEEAWQLEKTLDSGVLESFWSGVQRDLKQDPDWVDFSRDDDEA